MIKKLIIKSECLSCGSIISNEREFIIDEYLKKIELPKSKCQCGNKFKFKIQDIEIQ